MNIKKKVFITILFLIVLTFAFYFISDYLTKITGYSISEKSCISEHTLYINSKKPILTIQKLNLSNSDKINFYNCFNNEFCKKNKITEFPLLITNQKQTNNLKEIKDYFKC